MEDRSDTFDVIYKLLSQRDDLSPLCRNYVMHLNKPKFTKTKKKTAKKPRSLPSLLRTGDEEVLDEVEERLGLKNLRDESFDVKMFFFQKIFFFLYFDEGGGNY